MKTLILSCFNYPADSETLNKNAEIATLIVYSNIKRKRTNFLSKKLERIIYISPFYYPIFGVPWRSRTLLIHFGSTKQKELKNLSLTNVHNLVGDILRYSSDRKQFITFLKRGRKLFPNTPITKKIDVSSIIANHNLGHMIFNKAENLSNPEAISKITLPIRGRIQEFVEDFELFYKMKRFDLENLRYINQLITKTFTLHSSKEELEIQAIENNMHKKLNELLPIIRENIRVIEKSNNLLKRGEEKKYIRERNRLHKLREKKENELRRLTRLEASLNRNIAIRKTKDNRFKLKNKELRKYHRIINDKVIKIKEDEKSISNLDFLYKKTIKELNEDCELKIGNERQKILSLENQRDIKIHQIRDQITFLEKVTDKALNNIIIRIENKTQELDKLIDYSIPVKLEDIHLFYIQFYLIKYSKRNRVRYDFFTPVIININESRFSLVKRKISRFESKLSYLFKPFSEQLSSVIRESIINQLSVDNKLVFTLDEIAGNYNLLTNTNLISELKQGLENLSVKNILSVKEAEQILRTFRKY